MSLFEAVEIGDCELVKSLLEGKQLAANASTNVLLKLSLSREDFGIYQELVQRGAPISGYDEPGEDTLLHILARLKNVPYEFRRELQLFTFAKEMLDCELSVLDLNERNETPIHVAAKCESAKNLYLFMNQLMCHPDKIRNVIDHDGLSLFHIACTMPDKNYVLDFLNLVQSVDVNDAVSFASEFCPGYTALHFAAGHYRLETVKLLIELGADPTATTTTSLTMLHLACSMDHPDWLFHEISRRVPRQNAEHWVTGAWTNLQVILQSRNALVELLLGMELDVSAKDAYGHEAMYFVAAANYMSSHKAAVVPTLNRDLVDQVDTLVFYARPEMREHHVSLAVMLFLHAVSKGVKSVFEPRYLIELAREASPDLSDEMVDFLLKICPTNANVLGEKLLTPLHVAAQTQCLTMLKCLLKFRSDDFSKMADVNARDASGNTPLHYVERANGGCTNCIMITHLLKYGADLSLKNKKRLTGFRIVRRLMLHIVNLDDFLEIAGDEMDKIEKALLLRGDTSEVECNFWVELMVTAWKQLIMLESCDAPTHVGHDQLLTELEGNLLTSEQSAKNGIAFKRFCEEEVKRMKELQVSKFACLNDLLVRDVHEVAILTKREVLANVVKSRELDRLFPIYKRVLRARFIGGLARRTLLGEALGSLKQMASRALPAHCYHKILGYLSGKELLQLKKAGVVKK